MLVLVKTINGENNLFSCAKVYCSNGFLRLIDGKFCLGSSTYFVEKHYSISSVVFYEILKGGK